MTLLSTWWDLCYCALIHLAHAASRFLLLFGCGALFAYILQRSLLKPCVIKPNIVVSAILCEFILILDTALAKNSGFKSRTRAVLLLEFGICSIERCGFGTGEARKRKLGELV
jgi:hypothetical protein